MYEEIIRSERGSNLRKNGSKLLKISFDIEDLNDIFIINHTKFITKNLTLSDLTIKPHKFYMIINKKTKEIRVQYNNDISTHEVIYNPYKYENSKKENINPELFAQTQNVPDGYIDILTKWYSIKFAYPDHNLIFIKPEMGISIQVHSQRSEKWEILGGKPIIINGNNVWYYVENVYKFVNRINTFHSAINPNKDPEAFVTIYEEWSGEFDEEDILRVYNPNNYM
jgi:mannose-6-phosphate isomerase-like protein (cupin superfamily)